MDPQAAQAAAQWFARASEGEWDEDERRAWMAWRQSHPAHELAWQRVEAVGQRFGLLLPQAGMAALMPRPAYGRRKAALRAVALLCMGSGAGWLAWQQTPWGDGAADYRTATGERRAIMLADGTQLVLNTATAIDVHFSALERRIALLRGEVQVRTAHDVQQRPFVLVTRFGDLQPVGTRFVVRQHEAFTQLTVLEGAVRARAHGAAPHPSMDAALRVDAGSSVRLDGSGVFSAPESASPSADAWTRGLVVADGMQLEAFTAELSRYRRGVLLCDSAVADLRLSGAFPLDDIDRALAAVARALPVRIQYITPYWIRVLPA